MRILPEDIIHVGASITSGYKSGPECREPGVEVFHTRGSTKQPDHFSVHEILKDLWKVP
jgi:hypothetical protein